MDGDTCVFVGRRSAAVLLRNSLHIESEGSRSKSHMHRQGFDLVIDFEHQNKQPELQESVPIHKLEGSNDMSTS